MEGAKEEMFMGSVTYYSLKFQFMAQLFIILF